MGNKPQTGMTISHQSADNIKSYANANHNDDSKKRGILDRKSKSTLPLSMSEPCTSELANATAHRDGLLTSDGVDVVDVHLTNHKDDHTPCDNGGRGVQLLANGPTNTHVDHNDVIEEFDTPTEQQEDFQDKTEFTRAAHAAKPPPVPPSLDLSNSLSGAPSCSGLESRESHQHISRIDGRCCGEAGRGTSAPAVSHSHTASTTTPSSIIKQEQIERVRKKFFQRKKPYDFAAEMAPNNLRDLDENEPLNLTSTQRKLIFDAWNEIVQPGSNEPGIFIFKRIFSRNQDIKVVFHLHKIANSKLEESLRFQKHAQVFTNFIDIIVRSLVNTQDNLGPLLYYYGSKHVAFEKHHPFKPEYWNVFGHALLDYQKSWNGSSGDAKETRNAWKIMIGYLIKKMWEGFELEHERRIQRENEKTL